MFNNLLSGDGVIVLNSYTTEYSPKQPSKDIIMYQFRLDTGYIEDKMILGSSKDDIAYDFVAHHQGWYILASIGNNFSPHPTVGSIWGTVGNDTAFGLIWVNKRFELVNIEGYRQSTLSTLPMRVFPSTPDVYETQFMFIAPASTYEVNGGYFTQFADPISLYATNDCNLTCDYCNKHTKQNDCLSCDDTETEFLYHGECLSTCNIKTHEVADELTGNTLNHCANCHFSCKSCLGPRHDQCSECCTDGD